ncbi:MAG: peptidoglycan editing factor PgeF [Bacteroides sp.]|nr:peptidoglycan editing factor PgeF [Bacteroides sp.]
MKRLTSDNKMLGYELMKAYPNISCFSTTRHGGCSKGNYASFNCNGYCGDNPEDVALNREMLCTLLPVPPIELVIPHQTHSAKVRIVDATYINRCAEDRKTSPDGMNSFEHRKTSPVGADPWVRPNTQLEGIDALVTQLPGYCLCISTADCVPILLYDPQTQAIAAIHAGWRGTVSRIVENTLTLMSEQYGTKGKDLIACIGPSISLEAFEVGDEVYNAFHEAAFDMNIIARKESKWHMDLWEANRQQLLAHGVKPENIEISGICTYHHNDDFFSARRQGINSGRILSGIMIHPSVGAD